MMMKHIVLTFSFFIIAQFLQAQCSATLSYTAASCSTCCDACVTLNVTTGCPPYAVSWYPSDPTFPACSACPDTNYIATITDNCGCVASDSIMPSAPNGLSSPNSEKQILLYPNPISGMGSVKVEGSNESFVLIICDPLGREVLRKISDGIRLDFSTEGIAPGFYYYSIIQDDEIQKSGKMIIE